MSDLPVFPSCLLAADLDDAWDGLSKDGGKAEYPPVLTKHDFVRRFTSGEFGNKGPTWNSFWEWDRSHPAGTLHALDKSGKLYHIRNRIAGGATYYDVPASRMFESWMGLIEAGTPECSLYISEMAPTKRTLYQGEVLQTPKGLYVHGTSVAKPMREALSTKSEHLLGLRAAGTLAYYLCPNSYDWLMTLLERYPGHVIEFSTYGVNWGTLPGFNTVIWEVRNY